MFRTDLLSIIKSLNTVFTATGICHTIYVDCLLARSGWSQHTSMANTICCVYNIKTPDDGQKVCPKHVELFIKIKLRNSASCWLLLYECFTMHGPQNVKK